MEGRFRVEAHFTNGIGGFGDIHVSRPGADRLLWVEWTDGPIPIVLIVDAVHILDRRRFSSEP